MSNDNNASNLLIEFMVLFFTVFIITFKLGGKAGISLGKRLIEEYRWTGFLLSLVFSSLSVSLFLYLNKQEPIYWYLYENYYANYANYAPFYKLPGLLIGLILISIGLGTFFSSVYHVFKFRLYRSLSSSKADYSVKYLGDSKLINGRYNLGSAEISNSLREKHQLVLGSSGSGKTFSVLEPQVLDAINNGETVFIIDPKGDSSFRDTVFSSCVATGRRDDFRYFSMSNPDISHSFNPFGDCNPNEIKDMLIAATDWSEPHYKKMAELHIMKAIGKIKKDPNISDLLAALPNIKELVGISADLEIMIRSAYGRLINKSDAPSMFDLYAKGKVVFISLDSQAYPEASMQLGRIFLGSILSVSNRIQTQIAPENRRKTTIVCDEFGSFVTNSFINFISKARGSNFRAILATQSVGDLEQFKPEMRKRILDSISNKVIMRMSDPDSIEYCSRLFGTYTTTKETRQTENSLVWGKVETGVMSERDVEEFIVHPNEIRSLITGQGYLITQDPYTVFKINFSAIQNRFLKERCDYAVFINGLIEEVEKELGESKEKEKENLSESWENLDKINAKDTEVFDQI